MKRKRGGQPGNHNARTHGFYSGDLTPAQISEFRDLITAGKVARQEALLRVKLRLLAEQYTVNPRILKDAARLSAKWNGARAKLSKSATNELRKAIYAVLENQLPARTVEADK